VLTLSLKVDECKPLPAGRLRISVPPRPRK